MAPTMKRRSPTSLSTPQGEASSQPDTPAKTVEVAVFEEAAGNQKPQQDIASDSDGSSGLQDDIKDEADGFDVSDDGAQGGSSTVPLGKRRRVSRACDECRRKKIKCDGKQPCTHCSVYSYDCTYDKPSNRRRNPAPQYIEALETRLQRAESLLKKFMPDVDLADSSLDPMIQQEFHNRTQARARAAAAGNGPSPRNEVQDAQIKSMVGTLGQLDLSDAGEWDFHGISSGRVFLRRMREHFGFGADNRTPLVPQPPRSRGMFQLDSASSPLGKAWEGSPLKLYELPPKETVKKLCYYSLNCATCLLRIVHIPSFYERLDKLYDNPSESYDGEDRRFLGLLYAVLALGCMYDYSDESNTFGYTDAREKGMKFYTASRLILQDISECRDMMSLQALLFMILFLQSTSNMSDCYAFVGIALRSALRMGLHRHLSHASMTPIDDEQKRRAFHVIRQMDIYISSILGFPILLQEEDIDQLYPTEVDDEYITKEAILTPPRGAISYFQAFNAHARLMAILAKVIKTIYPLKGAEEGVTTSDRPNPTYTINYSRIKEMERELQNWYEKLPAAWRPGLEGPEEVVRVRTLLRFSYAQVQMMVYRPFLHYISPRLSGDQTVDERYYACAAAGISVCRNLVHLGIEIRKKGVLMGPYWFMFWSQFFSITVLVFYVVENLDKPGSQEMLQAAKEGRDGIATLASRSQAADRVTNALNVLFERLPERLKKAKANKRPVPTKKRSLPGPKASSTDLPSSKTSSKATAQQRRPDDTGPAKGVASTAREPQIARTASFDAARLRDNNIATATYAQGFQGMDLLPLDVGSGQGGGLSREGNHTPTFEITQSQTPTTTAPNPLYKLDTMMFSSGDPFAYPTQPLADMGNPQTNSATPSSGHPSSAAGHHADSMQFYMPNLYEDIDSHLLGSMPPYLVQPGVSASQQGISGMTGHFYDTQGLAGYGGSGPEGPGQSHGQGGGNSLVDEHQRQQQREFDELQMMTNPGFRGGWDMGGQFR